MANEVIEVEIQTRKKTRKCCVALELCCFVGFMFIAAVVIYNLGEDVSSSVARLPFLQLLSKRVKRDIVDEKYESHVPKADCGFMCDDGTCISSSKKCDNIIHCKNGGDELDCSCKDRIGLKKICDGIEDCPNGEDEKQCDCPEGEFNCADGYGETIHKCVPLSKRCDGIYDCSNNQDELDCFRLHSFNTRNIRGLLSNGILQKMIGNKWYTLCKDSRTDYLVGKYVTKTCQTIVGDLDSDPKIFEQKWNHDHSELNGDRFAMMGETESKFSARSPCSKVFKVTCPEPKCGWPASKFDKTPYSARNKRSLGFDMDQDIHGLTAKIVGGSESKSGDWPFLVGIYRNGSFHCGGMIIHKEWILSAAHCFHSYEKYVYEIQGGMLRRFSWSPHEQTRQVTNVYVHERYDSKIFVNDITLLKLDCQFYMSKYITTACLSPPDKSLEPKVGQLCSVIGWGDLAETSRGPDHMQEVELPVLPKCQETFTKDATQICAGFVAGGKDACQGDSGGPFICLDDYGRQILNGLVSFGRGCARPKQAGVYTRISTYIDWIESVVSGENKITKSAKPPIRYSGKLCWKAGGENLYSKMICDRKVDCLDGEDERDCEYQGEFEENYEFNERAYEEVEQAAHEDREHTHDVGKVKLCGPTEFQCLHSKTCVPTTARCNGKKDCQDGTDETGCECGAIIQNIYPHKICDNVWDCLDGSDEIDCGYCEGMKNFVKCPFSNECILEKYWCDGSIDCERGEDEIDCFRLVRTKDSIASEGFLSDKLSRGLQSGYLIKRGLGTKWRPVCTEDANSSLQEILCPYLGFRPKSNTIPAPVSSRNRRKRTSRIFTPRDLPVVDFTGRASDDDNLDSEESSEVCTQMKITCGEANCGERRLYSLVFQPDGAEEVGAQPWFVLVALEGSPICPATLVHKSWAIASTNCILDRIRSLNHEYITVVSGYSQKTPIVASPLEQVKRVNGIERLSGGFSLLHLDSPIMSDHFASPICTRIGTNIENAVVDEPASCIRILLNQENFNISHESVQIDYRRSVKGKYFAIRLNKTQCQGADDSFVYCSTDGLDGTTTFHYLGNTGTVDSAACKKNGFINLLNPFYGAEAIESEDIVAGPPSAISKPPTCLGVRCSIGNCVEKSKVCDGIYHCADSLDENKCQRHYQGIKSSGDLDLEDIKISGLYNASTLNSDEPPCPVGHFHCKSTGNCIPISAFCDQVNDCGPDDFSDEPLDPDQCTCRHYLEIAAPERVCDSEVHCPDKSDEIGCDCDSHSFVCDDGISKAAAGAGTECVNASFVCDGDLDCKNGKDEANCLNLSDNLGELNETNSDSGKGYAMVRFAGIWYHYCSTEWSKLMGRQICLHIGQNNLDSLKLFTMIELNEMETDFGNANADSKNAIAKTKFVVAIKEDEEFSSYHILDLDDIEEDDPWANCQIGFVRCA